SRSPAAWACGCSRRSSRRPRSSWTAIRHFSSTSGPRCAPSWHGTPRTGAPAGCCVWSKRLVQATQIRSRPACRPSSIRTRRRRPPARARMSGQRMIVCRTLGPVQATLEDGSAPADLQWAKNLALLVYLARSPRGTRSREHLIGLLWGDKPQSKARHSLNTALSLLRGYAGEESMPSDGTQVSLASGGVQLDTDQLEAFLAARDLAAAVALIKGEFLEGFSIKGASQFDDWMTAEREHWRRRSVETLLWRADELLAGGNV